MTVPIPSRKPTGLNSSNGSFLSTIWDTAASVFTQVSTIEIDRYEAKRLANLRAVEQVAKVARNETLAGTAANVINKADDPNVMNIALIAGSGMIAVAILLLLKG